MNERQTCTLHKVYSSFKYTSSSIVDTFSSLSLSWRRVARWRLKANMSPFNKAGSKELLLFLAVVVLRFVSFEFYPDSFNDVSTASSNSTKISIRLISGNYSNISKGDFANRNHAVSADDWTSLDNQTCIEQGMPTYPQPQDVSDWQTRGPYVLIIGAMKAGTTALNWHLSNHPLVATVCVRIKEMHFFDYRFEPYRTNQGILRADARNAYRELVDRVFNASETLGKNPKMIAFDDSPRYLFSSDLIPASVLCVAPWVKVIALLRNPVDRAYSHFTMAKNGENNRNVEITVEEWFQRDLDDLRRVGVIQDKIPLSQFSGSDEELKAWRAYTRLGTHAPIGRGLYAIQLRHWFKAFDDFGKSRSDVFVINSELMKEKTEMVYEQVLNFLQLPAFQLVEEDIFHGNYSAPLNNETRRKLNEFFAPYNHELYALLGPEWDGVWDQK